MKHLLLISILLPLFSIAQKTDLPKLEMPDFSGTSLLDRSEVDPFDSLYKVFTKDQAINKGDLYSSVFIKTAKFASVKKRPKVKPNVSLFVLFIPTRAITLDRAAYFQVQFEDGSMKKYMNESPYRVWARDETAQFYFTVPANDPLRTKKISAVRVGFDSGNLDAKASPENHDLAIRMIGLVSSRHFSYYD